MIDPASSYSLKCFFVLFILSNIFNPGVSKVWPAGQIYPVISFRSASVRGCSDGFYTERAERSLQAPPPKCLKAAPPKKCREASTTEKCHKAAPPKKCRKEGHLKICPPQKCCEAALQKVPCYV